MPSRRLSCASHRLRIRSFGIYEFLVGYPAGNNLEKWFSILDPYGPISGSCGNKAAKVSWRGRTEMQDSVYGVEACAAECLE
jgi:hypothetical protein